MARTTIEAPSLQQGILDGGSPPCQTPSLKPGRLAPRAGRIDEARLIFEKMLGYANHLGLYAEEVGPSGEALGNFPQAFSHITLISAAHNLNRACAKAA